MVSAHKVLAEELQSRSAREREGKVLKFPCSFTAKSVARAKNKNRPADLTCRPSVLWLLHVVQQGTSEPRRSSRKRRLLTLEKTGTRTSVLAAKRKLKMQSVSKSTTTTLNVNTNVKLWCSFATKFFEMASFKTMQDLIFKSVRLISLTMKNFLCCLTFSSGKTPAFRTKIIQLSTWMRWPSASVCQSLDLEKRDILIHVIAVFHIKFISSILWWGSWRGKMGTGISLIVDWENGIYSLGMGWTIIKWEWDFFSSVVFAPIFWNRKIKFRSNRPCTPGGGTRRKIG